MISENILKCIPEQYRAVIANVDNIHIALDAEFAIKSMDKAYLDDKGLMRWKSNDRIVPRGETIEVWILIGFITREQANAMDKADRAEQSEWLESNAEGLKRYMENARKLAREMGED